MEGRARDQRDDRRRGPLPAPLPRPARAAAAVAATAKWIRGRQRPDGSWATYYGGPGDLSTSVEAYVALRHRGRPRRRRAHDAARPRSSARRAASSRAASSRACGSRCSRSGRGRRCRPSRPSRSCCPPRAPLSVYSFGCWARQTIVALSVVTALAPVDDGRLRDRRAALGRRRRRRPRRISGARVFVLARPRGPRLRAPAGRAAPAPRAADRRALDRRAAGARRLLGRDPAAVGLVDRRAARARLPARPSGARARARRARQLHDRGRRGPAASRPASRPSGTPRSR